RHSMEVRKHLAHHFDPIPDQLLAKTPTAAAASRQECSNAGAIKQISSHPARKPPPSATHFAKYWRAIALDVSPFCTLPMDLQLSNQASNRHRQTRLPR